MSAQPASGVPVDLPPDELEQWSNDLVAYLTSDRVPSNFRTWARAQADQLDAYMASADDLDSSPAVEPVEEPAARVAAPKQARAPRPQPAAAAEPRTMVFEMPASTAKLILGVLAGLLVLGVVYGIVALTRNDGSSIPTSAATNGQQPTSVPFDTARAAELMKLVQADPANKDALLELGAMNFTSDRYADAITWYTKLSAIDPTNAEVMDDISTANLYVGDTDQAKVWAEKALAINPNDAAAHYNMGYVYASGTPQDLGAAVKEWDLVVQLDPTSPQGQTAKTHSDGLKAQMTRTAAAGSGSGPTIPPASKENTPVPVTTPTP